MLLVLLVLAFVFAFKLWAEVLACDGGLPPDLFLDAEFLLLSLMASVKKFVAVDCQLCWRF